jgi:hypothetical protein
VYAATLLTVWYVYRRGHLTRSSARSVTMLMGSVVLYFIIFYGMARTSHSYAFVGSTHAAAEYYGSMRSLITAVNIIGSTAIKICVSNLPYLMIMCIAAVQMNIDWSKMYRHPIAVLTVLLFVLSLLMWSALHFMFDSVQFWYLVYFPLIGIGAYYLLGTMLYRITCSRLLRVCAVLVLMLNIGVHPVFARESDLNGKFYMQIAHMVSQSPTATYAYIKSESDYNSAFEKSPTFIVPLHMLAAYTDVYLPVSLSVHDTPLDTSVYARHREISMIQSSPFYRFVAQQQADNIFVSLSHSQVAFIKQFHIQYLILSSSAQTSPMLEALFDEVIEDAGYGYQFIKLSI